MHQNNSVIPRVLGLLLVLVVGGGALVYTFFANTMMADSSQTATTTQAPAVTPETSQAQVQTPTPTPTSDSQTAPPTSSGSSAQAPVYKNGTYTATGSYISPGGNETIGVSITLDNDIITAVTVTPHPTDGTAARFQSMFVSGISSLVVGKNIADAQVSYVSGSSLTSGGFNQALGEIEAEAKA